jgi:hypothetical protein
MINLSEKVGEKIFKQMMEKMMPLFSTEEFAQLDVYKKELEDRVNFSAPR